jgi:drug/metabolite transporter (DMT)-like permease
MDIPDNRNKAIFAINLFAFFSQCTAVMFLKGNEHGLPVEDFMVFRCFTFFLFAIPALIKEGKMPFRDEPEGSMKYLIIRPIFGITQVTLFMWSTTFIPLALAIIVINLRPFWTSILAYLINKEPL